MAYTKYSLTAADNNSAPPNGAPEGMLPSAVNDTMRDMMSQIRDVGDGIRDGTYTMTAPKITGGTITGVTFSAIVITGGSIANTPISSALINNTVIGGVVANAGSFTTLTASGATTFSGTTVFSGSVSATTFSSSNATITGGSITGITDLAVADGGTGSSTLAANAVLLGNGTSALQTVAPSTTGNVLTSNGTTWTSAAPAVRGLGLGGEVWNDVTGSRASGTTYTNSRGYPIMIVVSTANGTSQSVTIVVGGVTVSTQTGGGSGYTQGVMGTAIVPTGSTYSATFTGSTPKWTELY